MMLLKCSTQYAGKFGKQQWPQDWKRSVFIPIPKKGSAKQCSNYHTIVLISQASKAMLKILQARLQQYMNQELVKWALGRITMNKVSGGDRIPAELFQILKGCCESAALSMPPNLENSTVPTGLEKVSFHSNFKER